MAFLKRALLYAGLEREEFIALQPEALNETRKSLRWYSLFATVIFALLLVAERFTDSALISANVWYYAFAVFYNAVVYFCVKGIREKHNKLITPLAYASVALLYATSISLTLLHPEYPAVMIIVVMVLVPFLFADSPIYVIALNLITTITLCLMTLRFKSRTIALDDCWNAISFCAVSLCVAVKQREFRFHALAKDKRIRYLSETDLLTGARNRNMYERQLTRYAKRCRESLTCVYIDVNGLHALNDRKGHKAGDVMLQTVAQALLERFGADGVFRIGGDEFVVFAPDAREEEVAQAMRTIKSELAERKYDISLGIATSQLESEDLQPLLAEAEKKMYEDKAIYYSQPGRERRRQ